MVCRQLPATKQSYKDDDLVGKTKRLVGHFVSVVQKFLYRGRLTPPALCSVSMTTWWLLAVACMGDQLSGVTLRAWHCLVQGRRRHSIRFESLREDPETMMLCDTVSRQHDMSAVTVFSRTCQMCRLAAIAVSSNGVCRLDFLQHLVEGGGLWDGCSLEPFAAQQCHILSWRRMPQSCMQPVCMCTYKVVHGMEVCWWWTV